MDEVSDWEAEGGYEPVVAPPSAPGGNGADSMTVTVVDKVTPSEPTGNSNYEHLGNYDVSRTWVNGDERWLLVKKG